MSKKPRLSNFPEEAFWWQGEASIERPNGGRVLLVLAREAAFGGPDEAVRRGDQVSFSRVRIRIDKLVPGAQYTVTHPYGTDSFVAEDDGDKGGVINFTEDIGCTLSPNPNAPRCDFRDALFGRVDPFLTWDPKVAPAPPKGYVGNPAVEHRVTGSPRGTNFFRIEGPDAGGRGTGIDRVRTNLFSIQGKIIGAAPTFLALRADPSELRAGRAATLSGRLSSFGHPLGDRPVILEKKPRGAEKFAPVPGGKLTTDARGNFSLRGLRPKKTTVYRAIFGGEEGAFKASRDGARVTVIRR